MLAPYVTATQTFTYIHSHHNYVHAYTTDTYTHLSGLEGQPTTKMFTLSVWESRNPSLTITLLHIYYIGLWYREQADIGDTYVIALFWLLEIFQLFINDEVDGLFEVIMYMPCSYILIIWLLCCARHWSNQSREISHAKQSMQWTTSLSIWKEIYTMSFVTIHPSISN